MRLRFALAPAAALILGAGGWILRGGPTAAAPASLAGVVRQNLELTIYSQDFGMVREVRPQQIEKGHNVLRLLDVSRQLDPQSVLLRWPGAGPNPPELVGHAYDLGVGNGDNLLKRYLGRKVEVVRYGQNGQE